MAKKKVEKKNQKPGNVVSIDQGRRASLDEVEGVKLADTYCEPSSDCKDFDRYAKAFASIAKIDSSARWWIGDLLNYGERIHGESYTQVETLTKISPDALVRYKHVSLRVAPERRFPTDVLHWGHHAEVAKLTPEEQTKWLQRAIKEAWTVGELREALRKKGRRSANKEEGEEEAVEEAVEKCACCHVAEPVAHVCEKCLGAATDAQSGPKLSKPHVDMLAWALEHIDSVDSDDPMLQRVMKAIGKREASADRRAA